MLLCQVKFSCGSAWKLSRSKLANELFASPLNELLTLSAIETSADVSVNLFDERVVRRIWTFFFALFFIMLSSRKRSASVAAELFENSGIRPPRVHRRKNSVRQSPSQLPHLFRSSPIYDRIADGELRMRIPTPALSSTSFSSVFTDDTVEKLSSVDIWKPDESLEFISDVPPLLISSYYLEETNMDSGDSEVPGGQDDETNSTNIVCAADESAASDTTPCAENVNFVDGQITATSTVESVPDDCSSSLKPVCPSVDSACYQSRSKNVVDLPVVTNDSAVVNAEPLVSKDDFAQTDNSASSDVSPISCSSMEVPHDVTKPSLEKRKTQRKEDYMVSAKNKAAKLEAAPKEKQTCLRTRNGQSQPAKETSIRPPAKPSKHAEIMAKLKESIRLDKDKPRREVKSRLSVVAIPKPKTLPLKVVEKDNVVHGRSQQSQQSTQSELGQSNRANGKKAVSSCQPAAASVDGVQRRGSSATVRAGTVGGQKLSPSQEKCALFKKANNALHSQNRQLLNGCVALSLVVDYFNQQVASYWNREVLELRDKVSCLSSSLGKSAAQLNEVIQDKERLRADYEDRMQDLEEQFRQQMSELKSNMTLESRIQRERLLRSSQETVNRLRENFETEKEALCSELTRVRLGEGEMLKTKLRHARVEHRSEIERLKQEWQDMYTGLQTRHADAIALYTNEIKDLQVQCEKYKSEACQLERSLVHDDERKKMAVSERFTNHVKEIESLRAVLEMKNEQNRQLQVKLKALEKDVEDTEKLKAKIALIEQKNDELKEALELKKMAERRLTLRHGDLLRSCEREKANSSKLQMDNEQLQFQLEQMMSKSACETPIHRQGARSSNCFDSYDNNEVQMSQSLIQIYADCSPRHGRERPVTVYTHEGVQKSVITDEGSRLNQWKLDSDSLRSRHFSGSPESSLNARKHKSEYCTGKERRRVQSSCEADAFPSDDKEYLRGYGKGIHPTNCADSDGLKETNEASSAGSSLDGPAPNGCTDSGIFIASYHSENSDFAKVSLEDNLCLKTCQ